MRMHDPIAQFNDWLATAKTAPDILEPTAMTLATVDDAGKPSARIVLLKQCDASGFLFYTNMQSRKSRELTENPHAALCFYWMPLGRQVRVEGTVVQAGDAEADAYFASRPRDRQIGAWASLQSQPLASREALDARFREMEKKYARHEVPRPPHWSGWRVVPHSIEFWQLSEARLHERHLYTRDANTNAFSIGELAACSVVSSPLRGGLGRGLRNEAEDYPTSPSPPSPQGGGSLPSTFKSSNANNLWQHRLLYP